MAECDGFGDRNRKSLAASAIRGRTTPNTMADGADLDEKE